MIQWYTGLSESGLPPHFMVYCHFPMKIAILWAVNPRFLHPQFAISWDGMDWCWLLDHPAALEHPTGNPLENMGFWGAKMSIHAGVARIHMFVELPKLCRVPPKHHFVLPKPYVFFFWIGRFWIPLSEQEQFQALVWSWRFGLLDIPIPTYSNSLKRPSQAFADPDIGKSCHRKSCLGIPIPHNIPIYNIRKPQKITTAWTLGTLRNWPFWTLKNPVVPLVPLVGGAAVAAGRWWCCGYGRVGQCVGQRRGKWSVGWQMRVLLQDTGGSSSSWGYPLIAGWFISMENTI